MPNPQERFLRHAPRDGRTFRERRNLWVMLNVDPLLLVGLLLASILGMFELYSASERNIDMMIKQAGSFVLGYVLLLVMAQIPPRLYRLWSPWFYLVGSILLIAVAAFGQVRLGARRWLHIPGVTSIQPSEFMKLAMPMMLAWFLSLRPLPPRWGPLLISLALLLVPAALIARQPDLGTAILVFSSGFFCLFLGGLPWWLMGAFLAASLPAGWVAWKFLMHDYQRDRIITLFSPESDPLGNGWNIIQSKTAIGSGGLLGKGWLHGSQSHLDFLPEGHTDFVIAAFSEEFGFIGVFLLILLYTLIIGRSLHIAGATQDGYGRLLAGSLSLSFFVYVFVNIGMVSGILPVVGVPLPFISYGGTAVVTLLAGFGILMSIHSHKKLMS
ncbi:MAG: rod shape-determining protein RodA [Pseudomonadales bacterium]|nr:rod shape-determining protein RodA [Pseudomonadales bacterium]